VIRNCLTVDVEEWFHVCGVGGALAEDRWNDLPSRVVANTRALLTLFDACGARGTFFVLGWVALRHPFLVEEIISAGHEVGSHGHLHRRVYEQTPSEFSRDLDMSLAALGAAGVRHIDGFRAPEWSINNRSLWALDVLAEKRFRYDSSMAPLRLIGDPDYPQRPHTRSTGVGDLLEFPPLVGRRFGQNLPLGGGWGLRMTAPARVIAAIDAHNAEDRPVALFVHPWEIDPDPPRARLPWPQRFAHYFRLGGFRERLHEILRGAAFAPMGEVLGVRASPDHQS
jgi:polysaccharide deacetylase family protein (PEP-CTERM system associated)